MKNKTARLMVGVQGLEMMALLAQPRLRLSVRHDLSYFSKEVYMLQYTTDDLKDWSTLADILKYMDEIQPLRDLDDICGEIQKVFPDFTLNTAGSIKRPSLLRWLADNGITAQQAIEMLRK
jgi:hypothetical protein